MSLKSNLANVKSLSCCSPGIHKSGPIFFTSQVWKLFISQCFFGSCDCWCAASCINTHVVTLNCVANVSKKKKRKKKRKRRRRRMVCIILGTLGYQENHDEEVMQERKKKKKQGEDDDDDEEEEDWSLFLDFFLDFLDLLLELLLWPWSFPELSDSELWLFFFFLLLLLLLLRWWLLQLLALRDDLMQSTADAERLRLLADLSRFRALLSSSSFLIFSSSPSEFSKLLRLNLIGLKLSTSLMAFSRSGSR